MFFYVKGSGSLEIAKNKKVNFFSSDFDLQKNTVV